jgi:hypothetical protein
MNIVKQGNSTQYVDSAQIGMDRITIQRDEQDSFVELANIANTRVPYEPPPKFNMQFEESPVPSPQPSPVPSIASPYEHPPYDEVVPMQPPPSMASYKSPEEIRREKSLLLYEIESKNKDSKYSNLTFTMDDSLSDLQNELELIKSRREMENSLSFWKRALLLSSEAIVFANNHFDPFSCDMTDWSRQLYFDVNNSSTYEQVLEEIAMKYKSSIKSPPEVRLMFLLLSSFGTAVVVKKQEDGLYRQLGLRQQQTRQNSPPQPQTQPPQPQTASNWMPDLVSKMPKPPSLPSHLLDRINQNNPTPETPKVGTLSPQEMRDIVKSMEVESRASSPAPSDTSTIRSAGTTATQESIVSETLRNTQSQIQSQIQSSAARSEPVFTSTKRGKGKAKVMVKF